MSIASDLGMELGAARAEIVSLARQRDALRAQVNRLLAEDDARRADAIPLRGHCGLIALAQLDWSAAYESCGGFEELAQFVGELACKAGYHDAMACGEKYQVEIVL